MLSYEGIFFDPEIEELLHSLEVERLSIVNDILHCTFKYRPKSKEIFNEIVGKEVEITVVGYACDGKNSGFSVRLPDEIIEYYINYDEENPGQLKIPHITASLAPGAKASKTKDLKFKSLGKEIKIKGRFGYWIKDGKGGHVSYEPYLVKKKESKI